MPSSRLLPRALLALLASSVPGLASGSAAQRLEHFKQVLAEHAFYASPAVPSGCLDWKAERVSGDLRFAPVVASSGRCAKLTDVERWKEGPDGEPVLLGSDGVEYSVGELANCTAGEDGNVACEDGEAGEDEAVSIPQGTPAERLAHFKQILDEGAFYEPPVVPSGCLDWKAVERDDKLLTFVPKVSGASRCKALTEVENWRELGDGKGGLVVIDADDDEYSLEQVKGCKAVENGIVGCENREEDEDEGPVVVPSGTVSQRLANFKRMLAEQKYFDTPNVPSGCIDWKTQEGDDKLLTFVPKVSGASRCKELTAVESWREKGDQAGSLVQIDSDGAEYGLSELEGCKAESNGVVVCQEDEGGEEDDGPVVVPSGSVSQRLGRFKQLLAAGKFYAPPEVPAGCLDWKAVEQENKLLSFEPRIDGASRCKALTGVESWREKGDEDGSVILIDADEVPYTPEELKGCKARRDGIVMCDDASSETLNTHSDGLLGEALEAPEGQSLMEGINGAGEDDGNAVDVILAGGGGTARRGSRRGDLERIRESDLVVDGSARTASDLVRVLSDNRKDFLQVYRGSLRADDSQARTVGLRFTIDPQGKVQGASVLQPGSGIAGLDDPLVRTLERVTFPATPGKPAQKVVWKLHFQP